jgi:hypothetical protein
MYYIELTRSAVNGSEADEINTTALRVTEKTTIRAGIIARSGSRHGIGSASKEERDDNVELHDCGVERVGFV